MLNVGWAAAIVALEVPLGALADLVGRKKLVVTAAVLMLIEMAIFAFAPTGNLTLLFWLFLANRVFSGAAEACASGADEALVFDSLRKVGREGEWTAVLERLNKRMAICFFAAMIVGAAVYNAHFDSWMAAPFHFGPFKPRDVVRLPIYLTLVSAIFTFYFTLRLQENAKPNASSVSVLGALARVAQSYRWILGSPVALFVMLATLSNDCLSRLIMTMTSKYYRLIHIPEISFGVIGSTFALLGYFAPAIAKRFIALGSARKAYAALSVMTLTAFVGLALAIPYAGLLFVMLTGCAMGVLAFLTSYYLNAAAEPSQRATILSFKGLTSNLAYGGAGIYFAALLKRIQSHAPSLSPDQSFVVALRWLPLTFLILISLAYITRALRPRPTN